jgi:hypothetical protein
MIPVSVWVTMKVTQIRRIADNAFNYTYAGDITLAAARNDDADKVI